jgi:UDP-N-acetylmuramate dehydrogenase
MERDVASDATLMGRLAEIAPDGVYADEPMARHTSFGLGGPADVFVEPRSVSQFREAAETMAGSGVPVQMLGCGTNILVRDGGIRGAVLSGRKAFDGVERTETGVRAGAGVGLPRLLSFCADEGLAGLEGLAGIPGSAGGAVVTNAGSFGTSVGERLTGISVSESGGAPRFVPTGELEIAYRRTKVPEKSFIEHVELALEVDDPEEIRERQRQTLERKWRTQPSGMRSAGCIFRNPPGLAAGRLIDEAGLKGTRMGGAVVSDLHANFLLNDRGATAEDVERLIELVRERVEASSGVSLELEIEIVGESRN